jgi:hypothetical protein
MISRATIAIAIALSACLAVTLSAGACGKATDAAGNQTGTNDMAQSTPTPTGDPWKDAEAVAAARTGARGLTRRTDELPYLFMAQGRRSVLVHKGAVVTDTGPAAAAAYLKDIGIVAGPGPGIDSVLHLLWALHALPKVEGKPEESYVHSPGNERMKDLTARIEREGGVARIVLHYFVDEDTGGGGDVAGPVTRYLVKMTLAIGAGADPVWKSEDVEWTPPD